MTAKTKTETPEATHKTTVNASPARQSGKDIIAAIGFIAIILAIIWAVWRFGGIVFQRITPDQATDRLGACIIIAAILHAYITTKRR